VPVPLFDTRTPIAPLRPAIDAKLAEVIDGSRFILGPEVEAFEAELAAYLGTKHAIGVANGTDAITLALRAMGVGPGDEVVVPSFTFYASAEAIPPTGARPVFCDVDPETFCVTAETVKAALTPRTKAVVVVHLFGNVAPVAAIEALGVPVLEAAGIGHKAYYRVPTHLQPAMRDYPPAVALPGTEEAARTHLAIPMSPVLSREQAAEVAATVRDAGLGRPH
jgi:dTDP-4-amino-4,6-dideoxygalactose transaminase